MQTLVEVSVVGLVRKYTPEGDLRRLLPRVLSVLDYIPLGQQTAVHQYQEEKEQQAAAENARAANTKVCGFLQLFPHTLLHTQDLLPPPWRGWTVSGVTNARRSRPPPKGQRQTTKSEPPAANQKHHDQG